MNKDFQIIFESGLAEFKHNKYAEAIKNFKVAYRRYLQKDDSSGAGASLNKIGEAHLLLQQYRPALNFLLKGFIIRKKNEDVVGILESLNSLGEVYYYIGNYDNSLKYYESCILESKKITNDYFLATALKNKGWLNFKKKKPYKLILKDLNQAVQIAEKLNRKRLLLSCYDNLGDIYFFQNDFVKSLHYFNKMLSVCDGTEYTHMEIRALKNIGNTHRELGYFITAESFLIRAMNLAIEKNILEMLRDCSLDKALLHERKREFRIAYLHFKNYHNYAMKIENEKNANKFLGMMEIEIDNILDDQNLNESVEFSKLIRNNDKLNNQLLLEFPDLSPRQVEIAGLIKNGMSSKEISVLLNIEVDSINKQRARIRKKMNLKRNQNLITSLQKLLSQ